MAFSIKRHLASLEAFIIQRSVSTGVILVLVLEGLSLLSYFFPATLLPILVLFGLLMGVVSYVAPAAALSLFVVELSYGAFGRMIAWGSVSLRMVLFGGFLLGYGARVIRGYEKVPKLTIFDYVFLVVCSVGVLVGLYYGNNISAIVADSNAYLFIPFFWVIRGYLLKHSAHFFSLLTTASLLFALKLLLVFIYFTGGTPIAQNVVYVYLRDTRVFEITAITDSVSRVFSSAVFIIAVPYLFLVSHKLTWVRGILLGLCCAAMLIGFSRSLLIGLLVAVLYLSLFDYKVLLRVIVGSVIGFLVVFCCMAFGGYQGDYTALWRSRTLGAPSEVATVSRFEQLPVLWRAIVARPLLGSGFGAALSMNTAQSRNDGVVMKTSFEWGYLDSFVKLGVGSLFLIYSLFRLSRGGQTKTARAITLTVLITHIFTPLLFHPLGMWMLVVASLLDLKTVHEIESTDKIFSLNF